MKATVQIHGEGWTDLRSYESEKFAIQARRILDHEFISITLLDAVGEMKIIDGVVQRFAFDKKHRVLLED